MQGSAWMAQARRQIKTDKLIEALQNHATSKGSEQMTNSQVRAAEVLLRKSLPDLKQYEHTGEVVFKEFCITKNGTDSTETAD